MIEHLLMVRWVVGSISQVEPIELFAFQPVFHDWFINSREMCYPLFGMVYIKDTLLLIEKSSP